MSFTAQAFFALGAYFLALFFIGLFWARRERSRSRRPAFVSGHGVSQTFAFNDAVEVRHTEVHVEPTSVPHSSRV